MDKINKGTKGVADALLAQLEAGENNVAEPSGLEPKAEELDIKEGHREELVCREDLFSVVEMDKVSLDKYAHSRLGKKLDLNKRLKMLQTEVVLLIKNKLKIPTDVVGKPDGLMEEVVKMKKNPEFVFNPVNRRIFEWTELLEKRTDLIECHVVDLQGKFL